MNWHGKIRFKVERWMMGFREKLWNSHIVVRKMCWIRTFLFIYTLYSACFAKQIDRDFQNNCNFQNNFYFQNHFKSGNNSSFRNNLNFLNDFDLNSNQFVYFGFPVLKCHSNVNRTRAFSGVSWKQMVKTVWIIQY